MLNTELGFSRSLCKEIVNAVFSNILEIEKEQKLILKNFGNFEVKHKNSRPRINFHNKSPITIETKEYIMFWSIF